MVELNDGVAIVDPFHLSSLLFFSSFPRLFLFSSYAPLFFISVAWSCCYSAAAVVIDVSGLVFGRLLGFDLLFFFFSPVSLLSLSLYLALALCSPCRFPASS
ncbi:hypothetical protein M407DRAFT_147062 [Tulasnella calospora MUT 4182]|uniref:Transmembrane protein n=1 Tax=Tulasnella calospora MUT 4182 TaxID=1051891 RepID=A0A0C3KDI8_9AGAM|nr:hypothetical protein M407DRAFT_147062 [Tulasnella calospora MUT 4182]